MARAPINGTTLQWAREAMHVERDELARAARIGEEKIIQFEVGEAFPTLRQLDAIAKKLDRTLAFFFTETPSTPDVPNVVDYRSHNGEPIPSLLAREMRRAEQHRETVIDLDGLRSSPKMVGAITWKNAATRAKQMRECLGLTDAFVPPESQGNQVLNFWRGLLEHHGFLVFQTTRIDLDAFRGLSIYHANLPIILLNGADSNNGKIFTLFHEVAHLVNRTSGMCDLDDATGEEGIANAFAASFLMPKGDVETAAQAFRGSAMECAEVIAKTFKVSVLAAGVRLRTLDLISEAELSSIRNESNHRWADVRDARKKRTGGPPPWRTRYRDLGSGYVGTIARALEEDRVDLLDASYLMNARVPMVRQILDEYYKTEGR